MKNNGPIIISSYGAACMQHSKEFSKKMQNEGYENSFTRQQVLVRKMFKENANGSIIADRIYQEWDWEHFTNYVTDPHKNIKDMLEHYKPCETGDRQYTLFCPQLEAFGGRKL